MLNTEIYTHGLKDFLDSLSVETNHPRVYNNGVTRETEPIARSEERYPDEERLGEILSEGVPLMVPRMFLHGRQENGEYTKRKRRLAEREIEEGGMEYLKENPVIVCALKQRTGIQLVIIDGHHRTRYSSKFGIRDIPCLIYNPEQLLEAFNIARGTKQTGEDLVRGLENDMALATNSFAHMSYDRFPRLVIGKSEIEQLEFARFTFTPKELSEA